MDFAHLIRQASEQRPGIFVRMAHIIQASANRHSRVITPKGAESKFGWAVILHATDDRQTVDAMEMGLNLTLQMTGKEGPAVINDVQYFQAAQGRLPDGAPTETLCMFAIAPKEDISFHHREILAKANALSDITLYKAWKKLEGLEPEDKEIMVTRFPEDFREVCQAMAVRIWLAGGADIGTRMNVSPIPELFAEAVLRHTREEEAGSTKRLYTGMNSFNLQAPRELLVHARDRNHIGNALGWN